MPDSFEAGGPVAAAVLAERLSYERGARGVRFVSAQRFRCRLNLSRLAPAAARRAWRRIQAESPALAALLREPAFQELRRAFDADVLIESSPTTTAWAAAGAG